MHTRIAGVVASAALVLSFATVDATRADATARPLGLACANRTVDRVPIRGCSGLVESFDHVPLDVDLTMPRRATNALPLLFMLHGWSQSKGAFESPTRTGGPYETTRFNSLWFASRGYAVVTATARGFFGSCGATVVDARCDRGWTHVGDRRYEVRDIKYLAGLLVDAGVGDPHRIGVTGFSWGGWLAMLTAVEGDFVTRADGTVGRWRSPKGRNMHLGAVVVLSGIADAVSFFIPNGRATDGDSPRLDARRPIGVERSYAINGFIGLPIGTGLMAGALPRFAPPGADRSADILSWAATFDRGEPYDDGAASVIRELARWHSALGQDTMLRRNLRAHTETPTLFVAGWDDDVHPTIDTVALARKLRRLDPHWPVGLIVGDVGDPRAQSKPGEWKVVSAATNRFLDARLLGRQREPTPFVVARVTTCDGKVGRPYEASHWSSLASRRIVLRSKSEQTTVWQPGEPLAGVLVDPALPSALTLAGVRPTCLPMAATSPSANPGSASWQWLVRRNIIMLGMPVVQLRVDTVGDDAEIVVRLWDVGPDGTRALVDRGVYRQTGGGSNRVVRFQLYGNGWRFLRGHSVELEVLQSDPPSLRPDNLPSVITYRSVELRVPAR